MPERLSDPIARKAQPGQKAILYDTEIRGFGLRITAAGAKAWILNYRVKSTGRERRLTIGDFPAWPSAKARDRAKELRQQIDQGRDPLAEAEQHRAAPTVADLIERYQAEHMPQKRPGSRYEDQLLIQQWILPELGPRKVAELTHADIEKVHRKVTQNGTSYRANRLLSLLSTMCGLAIRWGMRPDNPARGIRRNPEHPRHRYLREDEIARLMTALAAYQPKAPDAVDAIMLLLLTGARRNEVLSMRWGDLDLANGIWVKPPGSTKQARMHRVPLSPEAIDTLRQRLPNARSGAVVPFKPAEFVFAAGGSKAHQTRLQYAWDKIRAQAQLDDVRLHDLRHSFASFLVSAGRSLPEIASLLGHSNLSMTQRYSHLFDAPLRESVALVGQLFRGAK